jgi:hypothetical protein
MRIKEVKNMRIHNVNTLVEIQDQHIEKIKKMLKTKWKTRNIVIDQEGKNWRICFSTADNHKIFKFFGVVETYNGKILEKLWD